MSLIEQKSYNALAQHYSGDYKKLGAAYIQSNKKWTEAFSALRLPDTYREQEWKRLIDLEIHLALQTDKEFPKQLLEIPYPPHALYYRGNLLYSRAVSIVGTRKATASGLAIAERLSSELAKHNLTIVSGMALGIDAAAHEGALKAGGKTIAVLACGLETFYPRQNEKLGARIAKTGAVVSEYPPGTPAMPQRFLERNRITSGLSEAIVVVESPIRSGVRSTARFAIEQNREVFVIPGPITNPNYEGSHELIKSGAQLITSSSDILRELGIEKRQAMEALAAGQFDKLEKKHKIIIQALLDNGRPLAADALSSAVNLSPQETLEILTLLSLDGLVKEEGGLYLIASL